MIKINSPDESRHAFFKMIVTHASASLQDGITETQTVFSDMASNMTTFLEHTSSKTSFENLQIPANTRSIVLRPPLTRIPVSLVIQLIVVFFTRPA